MSLEVTVKEETASGKKMSVEVSICRYPLIEITAVRFDPYDSVPDKDAICKYDVHSKDWLESGFEAWMGLGTVEHRYGDGAARLAELMLQRFREKSG